MRCVCCNKNLNDYESTRKHAVTGAYLDTCSSCLSEIMSLVDLPTTAREDLADCGDIVDDLDRTTHQDYNKDFNVFDDSDFNS